MRIKSISSVFWASAVLSLAIWLLMETCSRKKPALSDKIDTATILLKEQTRLRDSSSKAQAAKDQQHKADSARWKKTNDSASVVLAIAKKKMNQYQVVTNDLAAQLDKAYENKDTTKFVKTCLELKDSVKTLNARVDYYEYQVDTLIKAKDSLQAVTQKRLDDKEQLLSDWRKSIDETDLIISGLQSDIKKAAKKADKKYSVVIGGGPSISTEGRPCGAAGIFIGRTVIRF